MFVTLKLPWKIFATGESRKTVDCWTITVSQSGVVELSDYLVLEKHTDFVRDVLVISNNNYSYLVSCGMDKKVYLWDLASLQCRITRSGHTAGVQCLAYEGRSVLLAGGFDYTIIGLFLYST